ncbi:TatD family hydrolase [Candidatus Gottesmanbacteria bacterium]|nr:TatD family hydrolase [Candidatus Gottesmanbacteria bacterium]
MLTFVDTHCHLNSKQFDEDLPKIITSSKKAGIAKMIVPGFDMHTSIKAIAIAEKYKGTCFATVGIHPYHASKVHDLLDVRKTMVDLIKHHSVCAIGEVGLDYHLYTHEEAKGKKEQQKDLLRLEIELAIEYNLPLILHCRSAWDDYIDILEYYKKDNIRGVSHCFEGGRFYLEKIISMGIYIGYNGLITFNNRLADILKDTPLESILLETDSPFLTPEPLRGTKNIPKNIRIIAKFIASIKGISLDTIASITTKNAISLFRLI